MSAPALRAEGLTVRFGRVTALDAVDLEVPSGSAVAVLGPNGAGKSTLFGVAVGLVEPTAGSLTLGGERVAFVPQQLSVEPIFPITAEDVVRMGRYGDLGAFGRWTDRDHELVAEAMRLLEVEEVARRRFGLLSGGQRQRTLLAQAVAQDADLLLLDEPLTGVDAPTRDAVRHLFESWRAQGRTVIVATHDLESAAREFDLVVCLNGRLVAYGEPAHTLDERVLAETFAGRVLRVGDLLVDVAHHHHGAG